MLDPENPNPETGDPIALGAFLRSSPTELFRRTILDVQHLISFRPWLHRLTEIFVLCCCIGLSMLLYGHLLLAPELAGGMWLMLTAASLWTVRSIPDIRAEYYGSMVICTVSILGWVALVADPMSSLVSFSNLIFITFLVFTLTPLAGFSLLILSLVGLYVIRATQMVLGLDPGLALPPLSWIEATQVGMIFWLHFISIWFLVNLLWVAKQRNVRALALLGETNEQLRASEQARNVFLSTITHELRTPLTSIQGYADLMLADPAKNTDGLAIVKHSANKLEHLINEFLNLADAPTLAGRMTPQLMRFDHIVGNEVAGMLQQAKEKGVALQWFPLASSTIHADPLRIAQVVTNLLENAIQHTRSGKSITVTLTATDDTAVLQVTDCGAGISKDDLPHIFDPFFTRESAVKKCKGAGLGLTLCKQIILASGGTIAVESKVGASTKFTIGLPLFKAALQPPIVPARAAESVLILDDDPAILTLMQQTISGAGIKAEIASDGLAALTMALQKKYDVIILDINVPEMTGIEVSRRLREAGSEAKIFLFSAMPERDAAAAVLEARADGYIPKPYNYDALLLKLSEAGLDLQAT